MAQQHKAEPIVKEVLLDAAVDRVWQALTDPNKMKEWYFNIPGFKPEVGFEFSFIGQDHDCIDYVHLCRITEVVPGKKLVHTWRYKGYDGDSVVSWELFPDDGKTRLVLTHTGIETFPPVKAFAKNNFNEGWTAIVSTNLPAYLAKQ